MPPKRLSPLRPSVRLWLASAMFSGWMVFVLVGWVIGGAIHLLLAAALMLFPWHDEASGSRESETQDGQASSSSQPAGDS